MKAQPISRTVVEDQSIMLSKHNYDNFLNLWHYHPEIELAVILESTGTRFVGDSIKKFEPGEVIMIGKNLPHLWLNDKAYFSDKSDLKARAHVIHFHKNFPDILSNIPEMGKILDLFERAQQGIKFEETSNSWIISTINSMFDLHGLNRYLAVLDVLKFLAEQEDYHLLSSAGYLKSFTRTKDNRMRKVLEYIMNNFTKDISLTDVAEHVNMNASSFSRYFKRANKKTFTKSLNEVRVGFACKLLIEKRLNISEVCYRSGFNSVSNFNRRFKEIKQMTPTEYIRNHPS